MAGVEKGSEGLGTEQGLESEAERGSWLVLGQPARDFQMKKVTFKGMTYPTSYSSQVTTETRVRVS